MIEFLTWLGSFVSLVITAFLDAFHTAPTAQVALIVLMVILALASCACAWVRTARNPPTWRD